VYEHGAFSWTSDGKPDVPAAGEAWTLATDIAASSLTSETRWVQATHYHATYVNPAWANDYVFEIQVGDHLFFVNDTPFK
jgi:spore germination cell wall hydrolase CwlJ-like protein